MFTKMHCQQFHVGMVFTRPMPWMCHTPQQGTCTVSYSVAHRSVARHPTEWTCWCLLVLAHTVVSEVRWHRGAPSNSGLDGSPSVDRTSWGPCHRISDGPLYLQGLRRQGSSAISRYFGLIFVPIDIQWPARCFNQSFGIET